MKKSTAPPITKEPVSVSRLALRIRWLLVIASLSAGGACAATRMPVIFGLPLDHDDARLSAVWIGHATVLLRFGKEYVLTDPNLSGALYVLPRDTPASIGHRDLPFLTAAVASHMHFDHFDRPTIRRLLPTTALFYPAGGESYAGTLPQERKEAMKPWQSEKVGGLTITAVPVSHFGGRYGIDSMWNDAYTGFVIEGAGRTVFFAGDTGYHPEHFRKIGERFPDIDLALIPIAPYRNGKGNRVHANPVDALKILEDVGARYMLPIHFEGYYGFFGGYDTPRRDLAVAAAEREVQERVFALYPGERWLLPEGGEGELGTPVVSREPRKARRLELGSR